MLEEAILKTLAYADIFAYPLDFSQIQKFLIWERRTSREEVARALRRLRAGKKIGFTTGFYFLRGREKLVEERKKREIVSRRKLRLVEKIAFFLKPIPYLSFVGVTGRLALGNSREEDDLDLLLITRKGALWLGRMLAIFVLEFLGVRRRPEEKEVRDKVCLNVFLEEGFLSLPSGERNLYTAHEIAQVRPVWERGGVYRRFLVANQWVREYLPNAIGELGEGEEREGEKSAFLLESLARKIQFWYMQRHKTGEKVDPHHAFFHPQSVEGWVLREYRKRVKELGL